MTNQSSSSTIKIQKVKPQTKRNRFFFKKRKTEIVPNVNLSEEACRVIFETLFGKKFKKCRPNFLEKLELDGYCPTLKLAFEYQGRQHYEYVSIYHRKGLVDLHNQQKRDILKRKLCKLNGVRLIEIPHIYTHNNKDEMKAHILNELIANGVITIK